jgi:hypothetical protein
MSDNELQEQLASQQLDESSLALVTAEARRRGLLSPEMEHTAARDGADPLMPGYRQLIRGLSPLNAQILLGRLHADGIDAHLSGANITQAHALLFQALGGVRLFVREDDLAKAIDVMREAHQGSYEMGEAEEENAAYVDRIKSKRLAGWVIVLLVAFVFGGIALVAIWSPSYAYFPYSTTPEPASRLMGKWMMSILIVSQAALWLVFVESAIRRQRRQN